MSFDILKSLEILTRTPRTLQDLLLGLPPEWVAANEGPDTWSVMDVVGHLIHGEETDWIPRARIILEQGESRAFDPFDRTAQFVRFRGWTLEALLTRFAEARVESLVTFESWRLKPAQLELRGRHPELGATTLGQLLATWVVHDLGHIAQITRVMAKQSGDATGPWKAYLPVLTRR